MKRKRFSEEQIIKILQAHESGVPLADRAREHGFAEGTIYTWKARYGGMAVSEATPLRKLEVENKKLKTMSDQARCDNRTSNLQDTFRQRVDDLIELVGDHRIYYSYYGIVKTDAPGIPNYRSIDAGNKHKRVERIAELLSPGIDHGDNRAGWLSGTTSGRNEALSGSSVGRGILTPFSRWR